jgi:arylsulfatase A-like enzyme
LNDTDIVFTADHGMVPNSYVPSQKKMYAAIQATGAPALEDDVIHTAGYIYLRDQSQSRMVAADLAADRLPDVEGALYRTAVGGGYQADPATAKELGPALTQAYVDLCNTMDSDNGPDVVLPYREDTIAHSVTGYGPHWGDHGGLSWRVQSIPLVISGPGVRHGTSAFPAKLVDIAPTIERLMGLPIPSAVDGVVLADALTNSSTGDRVAQLAPEARRAADERALVVHSEAQHALVFTR